MDPRLTRKQASDKILSEVIHFEELLLKAFPGQQGQELVSILWGKVRKLNEETAPFRAAGEMEKRDEIVENFWNFLKSYTKCLELASFREAKGDPIIIQDPITDEMLKRAEPVLTNDERNRLQETKDSINYDFKRSLKEMGKTVRQSFAAQFENETWSSLAHKSQDSPVIMLSDTLIAVREVAKAPNRTNVTNYLKKTERYIDSLPALPVSPEEELRSSQSFVGALVLFGIAAAAAIAACVVLMGPIGLIPAAIFTVIGYAGVMNSLHSAEKHKNTEKHIGYRKAISESLEMLDKVAPAAKAAEQKEEIATTQSEPQKRRAL